MKIKNHSERENGDNMREITGGGERKFVKNIIEASRTS